MCWSIPFICKDKINTKPETLGEPPRATDHKGNSILHTRENKMKTASHQFQLQRCRGTPILMASQGRKEIQETGRLLLRIPMKRMKE